MRKCLLLCIMLALLPWGIKAQNTNPETITIRHGRGETTIKKNPQNVVVFDLGSLETFHELGLEVAAVPDNCPSYLSRYADQAKYLRAGSLVSMDKEKVAALKPDLIIISGRLGAQYDSLSLIAPTVHFATDLEDYWNSFASNVRAIASLYGKEALAEQKLSALNAKADLVRAKARQDEKKTLIAMSVNGRFVPNGPGSRHGFMFDVLQLNAAYTPPAGAAQSPRGQNSAPSLDEINPDYLFIFDRGTGIQDTMPALSELLTDEVRATTAFKDDKVFLLPGMVWYASGGGLISVDKQITDLGEMLYGLRF